MVNQMVLSREIWIGYEEKRMLQVEFIAGGIYNTITFLKIFMMTFKRGITRALFRRAH
jgi:hypothetical protein